MNKMKLIYTVIEQKKQLSIMFVSIYLLMASISCKKESKPDVITSSITGITASTAVGGGSVTSDGGSFIRTRGVVWNTDENPTVDINIGKTNEGNGSGDFSSIIKGLTANATYYVRAYATNGVGISYGNQLEFVASNGTMGTGCVDTDGNKYQTIIIGNQEWMAENLRTTTYNDGTPIPNVTSINEWANLSTGAYSWYDNNQITYGNAYGALYNWYAMNTLKLCPIGWHLPSIEEWSSLILQIDSNANFDEDELSIIAGGKMKSTRTVPDTHPRWEKPNLGANDEFGFSALPGGFRVSSLDYGNLGYLGFWWSSTEYLSVYSWGVELNFGFESINRSFYFKEDGLSVRCLKDN